MAGDFFVIDVPVFIPKYDEKTQYGYTKYKNNLWKLLTETTEGYCMYCYDTVVINRQKRGQIEHGIEKMNSPKYLTDCVPNLGLACEICNAKYKKRGERKRRLSTESIAEFEENDCRGFECKKACEKFERLRREYVRNGKIIIQPFEVRLGKDRPCLRLQYDLIKCKYIPSQSMGEYTEEEIKAINEHIKLFGLNTPERKNYEIGKFCKNVINNQSLMEDVEYDNLIVQLFKKKLQDLEISKAIKICEVVYGNAFMQLAT